MIYPWTGHAGSVHLLEADAQSIPASKQRELDSKTASFFKDHSSLNDLLITSLTPLAPSIMTNRDMQGPFFATAEKWLHKIAR